MISGAKSNNIFFSRQEWEVDLGQASKQASKNQEP